MQRCLQLAELASGDVAPNPMVGAVLVYDGKIIGEGYHKEYGKGHAEVNCLAAVKEEHRSLIPKSSMYVSLEPCAHFGKTPPCADLIIRHKIAKVVIGCRDPFAEVNGKGMEKLRSAGIAVELGILEAECKSLNKRFFTFHTAHRPFITLKWAQTADGKVAGPAPAASKRDPAPRLLISNEYTNRLVHKWRSEEVAIVVGTNTALYDDPQLSTRHWPGSNPIRVVVDMNLRLPPRLQLFNGKATTLVFNKHRHTLPQEKISIDQLRETGLAYYQVTDGVSVVHQLLNGLYQLGIQSILVEGGTQLLQSFINEGLWDEARIISNENLHVGQGLSAPQLPRAQVIKTEQIFSDRIRTYKRVD